MLFSNEMEQLARTMLITVNKGIQTTGFFECTITLTSRSASFFDTL